MKANEPSDPGFPPLDDDLPEGWRQPACAVHEGVKPAWRCRGCGTLLCGDCVSRRMVQTMEIHFCSQCGADCESLMRPAPRTTKMVAAVSGRRFGSLLVDSFAYPVRGHGWSIILGGAILLWGVDLLAGFAMGLVASVAMALLWLLLVVFGTGYLAAYMFSIIQHSARGEEALPDWPDFGDFWNDMFLPFLRLIGTLLFCFGPALFLDRWLAGDEVGWLYWLAFSAGLLYAPMALIAVAQFDSIAAVSPLLVIPSILKTFGQYIIACLVLGVAVGFGAVGPEWAGQFIPWFGGLISWCLSLYFLFVQMRILGALYHCNEDRLNWFPGAGRRGG